MSGVIVTSYVLLSKLIGLFLFDLGISIIRVLISLACSLTNLYAVCTFLLESHLFDIVVLCKQILLSRLMPSINIIVIWIVLKGEHFWVYVPRKFVFPFVSDSLSERLLQIDVLQDDVALTILIIVIEYRCILYCENVLLTNGQFVRWVIYFHAIQLLVYRILLFLLHFHFCKKQCHR